MSEMIDESMIVTNLFCLRFQSTYIYIYVPVLLSKMQIESPEKKGGGGNLSTVDNEIQLANQEVARSTTHVSRRSGGILIGPRFFRG